MFLGANTTCRAAKSFFFLWWGGGGIFLFVFLKKSYERKREENRSLRLWSPKVIYILIFLKKKKERKKFNHIQVGIKYETSHTEESFHMDIHHRDVPKWTTFVIC